MTGADITNLVIGVVVLVWVVSRQLTTRRLRENYRLPIILGVIGIVQFATFLKGNPRRDGAIAAAVAGSLVIAAAFGVARAVTVRVWRQDGQLLRRGTWLTAGLWVLAFAAHLGYDYLVAGDVTGKNGANVGNATILLYLVVSLAIQQIIMLNRAARLEAANQLPVSEPV